MSRFCLVPGFVVLFFLICLPLSAQEQEVEPPEADSSYETYSERQFIQLNRYKPVYFIYGNPDSKLQLSLKAMLFRNFNLYFAYTQLMLWTLTEKSAPMRDINFNPEVFYRLKLTKDADGFLDFGFYEHESNGRSGKLSRSWDRAYLRWTSRTSLGDSRRLVWSFKAFAPYNLDNENKAIARYRGLWELSTTLTGFLSPIFDISEVTFRLYPGGPSHTNPLRGGQELTIRAKWASRTLLSPIVWQIFHGYGEYLLDYNERKFIVRVGLGF